MAFSRDIEHLYKQYEPLRTSIASRNLYKFLKDNTSGYTSSSQSYDYHGYADLEGYIDTEFVRLVREYDINGPIDFPGYILKKLSMRVSGTHLSRRSRNIKNETPEGNSASLVFSELEDPKDYSEIDMGDAKKELWDKLASKLLKEDADDISFEIGHYMIYHETSNFNVIHRHLASIYSQEELKNSRNMFNHVAQELLNNH